MPNLVRLGQTERIEQQTSEQKQGHATICNSLVKVQYGTIHAVGSLGRLAVDTGIVPELRQGAELYFVIGGKKGSFPTRWFKEAQPQ